MSDSIDSFEPEGFIPNDLRPSYVTFKCRKAGQIQKAGEIYKNVHKRTPAGSVESVINETR